MELSFIKNILECIKEYKCKIDTVEEGVLYNLYFGTQNPDKKYELEFYEVDGAGTLGLKILWHLGKVVDANEIRGCLVLNSTHFKDAGPLYAAVLPIPDEKIVHFLLVGQMIFPPNTPPEEVATLLFNNAYLNYALTGIGIDITGVKLF